MIHAVKAAILLSAILPSFCGVLYAAERSGLWLDVPFVKQDKEGCGAASISMVMQYWQQQERRPANPNAEFIQIEHALHSDAAHGIYASDMERYFRDNGYTTFAFSGELADFERHLANGRPLIVALKPGAHLPLHYVVVAGLDPQQRLVLVNDPAERKLLKEDYSRFEQDWNAAGHWTLLAVPGTGPH
jgi:ABC-type bacteriocin/lantibiotic exporter with double-glycine peptidase domain